VQFINTHNDQQKPNLKHKKEGVKRIGRPAGNIESWDDDVKCHGCSTHSKSWRERVPDFRNCNAEAVGTE